MSKSVEPIREFFQIARLYDYFYQRGEYRNWLLMKLGFNLALRISDLRKLKVSDVYEPDMTPKTKLELKEQKTRKTNIMPINSEVQDALRHYREITGISYSDTPLFRSKKGGYLSRYQAYRIINKGCQAIGVKAVVGTHTFRKTWGYQAFKRFGLNLDTIMLKLNHSSVATTKLYIGLTYDEKAEIENMVQF